MKSSIQFLTTPTVDTNGTALVLSFDDRRYLIGNMHEGIQRACIERGVKLGKVTDIFLTGKTEWKNTGGLIGMVLSLADITQSMAASVKLVAEEKAKNRAKRLSQMTPQELAKQPKNEEIKPTIPEKHSLTIHGGPNTTHTLATTRRFVFRKGMPINVDEFTEPEGERDWGPTWSDQHIRVWAISVEPSSKKYSVRPTSPQSPRKRSFDEYKENHQVEKDSVSKEEADRNQQIRRAVVSDMFDSDWRLDALMEVPIAQVHEHVQMPATLFIRNPETKLIERYSGPVPGGEKTLLDYNVLVRKPWPGALVEDLPTTKPSAASLSYIVRKYSQRGKFLIEKATALKVDKVLFKELANGNSVTSIDGQTVLPEQVLEKGKPGTGFAIIELPSRDYVHNFVNRLEWRVDEIMEGVEMFIWILGPGVGQDEALTKFMTEFGHLKHIVSSQDHCPNSITMDSASAAAIRRNQIDPDRYPVPIHYNSLIQTEEPDAYKQLYSQSIIASRGLTIEMEPFLIKKETSVETLNTAEVLKETGKDVLLLAKGIRQDIASDKFQTKMKLQSLPSPDAEMIFLGTGSALPSKYRNVSATLLRVPGSGSYLLDCGENTLGQLSRVYTSAELLEVLQDLKMIWISHMHADHHLGITSVIKAWYKAVYGKDYTRTEQAKTTTKDQYQDPAKIMSEQKRLFVATDRPMNEWLKEYSSVEDFGYDKLIPVNVYGAEFNRPESTKLDWDGVPLTFDPRETEISAAMKSATGLLNLAAANVSHCHGAKAVSLTFPTGFKFSYSGDCRPSPAFAEIGQGSTVLLHEATFDDELRGDARAKKHCTTSEAIGIGVAMGAPRVMLTHFSQRYQKLPKMDGMDRQEVKLTFEGESDTDIHMDDVSSVTADTGNNLSLGEMVECDSTPEEVLRGEASSTHGKKTSRSESNSSSENRRLSFRKYDPRRQFQRKQGMKVGVAFDYMRVKVKDIALLEKFTPVFMKLYENEASIEGKEEVLKEATAIDGKKKKNEAIYEKRGIQQSKKRRNEIRNEHARFDEGNREVRRNVNIA